MKSRLQFLTLCALFALVATAFGQTVYKSLTLSENGTITAPTNFWTANPVPLGSLTNGLSTWTGSTNLTIPATQISDSTSAGRSMLTATNATEQAALLPELTQFAALQKTREQIWLSEFQQQAGRFCLLAVGDSMAHRKPDQLKDSLINRYGLKGLALDALQAKASGDAAWSGANTGVMDDFAIWETGAYGRLGPGGVIEWGVGAGASNVPLVVDTFSIYYVRASGGGSFSIESKNDTGAWTNIATVDTDNGGAAVVTKWSASVTKGFYLLRVVGSTGECRFIGAKMEDSSVNGLVYVKATRGGLSMSQQLQCAQSSLDVVLADVNPSLVVFEQKDSLSGYDANLRSVLARWKIAAPSADWCLVGTTDTQVNDSESSGIRDVVRTVASENGHWYFDANAAVGGWGGIIRVGWDTPDSTHLDDAAHIACAQIMLPEITTTSARQLFLGRSENGSEQTARLRFGRSTPHGVVIISKTKEGTGGLYFDANDSANGAPFSGFYVASSVDASTPNAIKFFCGANKTTKMLLTQDGRLSLGSNPPAPSDVLLATSSNSNAFVASFDHLGTPASTTSGLASFKRSGVARSRIDGEGNFETQLAGVGIKIKEGSNARMGQSTLSSGTVTVSNTSVTANTRIFVSRVGKGSSTAIGALEIGTITASTSFVINSLKSDATTETGDLSVVNWMLFEPAP